LTILQTASLALVLSSFSEGYGYMFSKEQIQPTSIAARRYLRQSDHNLRDGNVHGT